MQEELVDSEDMKQNIGYWGNKGVMFISLRQCKMIPKSDKPFPKVPAQQRHVPVRKRLEL